jgi:beta-glucosidase-like glycosyl hydrolase
MISTIQMKKYLFLITFFGVQQITAQAFLNKSKQATKWVDSVFKTLNADEKIAQLIIIRAHSNLGQDHIDKVVEQIKKYNVGGLCFFQGGPVRQANLTNYYQSIAKTPLLVTMDAEWGIGMRLDSVILFPKNMMLGAMQNNELVYKIGKAVGKQCKRMRVHLNYAPVVDVNNNPNNPVINDRSFGEDKNKVSNYATQYSKGLQSEGVMACAKHFPGHGDVAVDSHLDLPVVNKSIKQLTSLELFPFAQQIKNNVGCMMMAHLAVPALDTTAHLPTSLSKKVVTGLLKNKMGFKGLIITDGLEMKGITKYFSSGDIAAQAIIAGNDLLCLPEQTDSSIFKIKQAIKEKRLSQKAVDASIKKILLAKYNLGLNKPQSIITTKLVEDLNNNSNHLIGEIAENAITIVKQANKKMIPMVNMMQPLDVLPRVAHIIIGNGKENDFAKRMQQDYHSDAYFFSNSFAATFRVRDSIEPRATIVNAESQEKFEHAKGIIDSCTKLKKYDVVIISVHQYNRRPANNFGLDSAAVYLMQQLSQNNNAMFLFFGNPYAIKNISSAQNIIACYDDDAIVQNKAADLLQGKFKAKGKLPVSVCE